MAQCYCPKCGVAHEPSQKPMALLLELLAALEGCVVRGMMPDAGKKTDRFVAILNKCKKAVQS